MSKLATDLAVETDSTLIVLPGQPALSNFRLTKLLQTLKRHDARIQAVNASYTYFASVQSPLSEATLESLKSLLLADDAATILSADTQTIVAAPRPGTISPWSSKATDIAQACGLLSVKRIERGISYSLTNTIAIDDTDLRAAGRLLIDRMTESLLDDESNAQILFESHVPDRLRRIPLRSEGTSALQKANTELGLALSSDEIEYLYDNYTELDCDPSDAELMMFAQANSEHCRHKIFHADWVIDGEPRPEKLFDMIKSTTEANGAGVLSAYTDNSAVIEGHTGNRLISSAGDRRFEYHEEPIHILMKVETHNHPTAISPFPGAATGSGGEIRDEGATGLGAKPKAGLSGFTVSHLRIPEFAQPWEQPFGHPERMATPLEIMIDGPVGAAAFNNEFGRPNLLGYFRTFETAVPGLSEYEIRGYHKPIMIAGGVGNVRAEHALKQEIPVGARVVVLGGPAMLIGLGGGAASSLASGSSSEDLDFASVQRGNPEMERRAQEVIDRCWAMGTNNPILLIHDVGAGGLSNAVLEAVDHSKHGARIELRDVPNAEPGLSPMAIWCNEAQERYVIIIADDRKDEFARICERERCPHAVIGTLTDDQQLQVTDRDLGDHVVDMPMELLLGKAPKMSRDVSHLPRVESELDLSGIELDDAVFRVLRFPAVADKSFLINIGDRTVGGLSVRDQFIGPWQVAVSDVAITASGFECSTGEAMAMGERTPLAALNAPASGRMAVGEAVTNIAAAAIDNIKDIRLSANWMAAAGHPGEDANLFDTVKAVGLELCRELGIAIPVGKDSLSMRTRWDDGGLERQVVAPVSLIVSAFAPVTDVRRHLTPQLKKTDQASYLLLIDLGDGTHRMGGSCLAQTYSLMTGSTPDIDDAQRLQDFFAAIQSLSREDLILAYHDRSDGGLLATVVEMMIAGRLGASLRLHGAEQNVLAQLFNEELGAVIQVAESNLQAVRTILEKNNLNCTNAAQVESDQQLTIHGEGGVLFRSSRAQLQRAWSETSFRIQTLRDNPETALEEFDRLLDERDPGLNVGLTFDPAEDICAALVGGVRPRVAILREQGVNSQYEMAAAFIRAGFDAIDVHMSDLHEGRDTLQNYQGIAACGGFSFGDVLGAGGGWARSILNNERTRDQFAEFFLRPDGFSLGVCNGCQMMSHLKALIPGAQNWPRFQRNRSEQFEARLNLVSISSNPSLFFNGMDGCRIPIVTSHGEGRAVFRNNTQRSLAEPQVALRYVDNYGDIATTYPANPNGSADGICGLSTEDGRVTIMMPHPERVVRTTQNSWHPDDWGDDGPWIRIFRNARNAIA